MTPPEPGEAIGRYVVSRRLGSGAMGVVVAAYDPKLDREVALKLLRPHGDDSHTARARLLREARAMARLGHPNVVTVHDAGEVGDRVWVAMELVRGTIVRAWQEAEPRSWREVLQVYVGAARGLAAAHEAGLLHRDVKPDNIMLDESGRARVMDFGLARPTAMLLDERTEPDPSTHRVLGDTVATDAGTWLGTPAYMAPEQWASEGVDPRTDQFALCVAMWEALFGQRPFAGTTVAELATVVTTGQRRPPPDDRVPPWLRRALERGLSTDPAERWPNLASFVEELTRSRTRGHRTALALGTAGLIAIGVFAPRTDAALCSGTDAQLQGIWDHPRRGEIRDAVSNSEVSFGPAVLDRIEPRIDAWVEQWQAMHTESCEATRLRGEQSEAVMDLRMACLNRARMQLTAATDLLARPTFATLERADTLIDELGSLDGCADVTALQARVAPPSPEIADDVATAQTQLAEASARRVTGDYDGAWQAAARVSAGSIDYPPLATEIDLEIGRIHVARGEPELARAAFGRARRSGARLGQMDEVFEATLELMYVLAAQQGQHEHAMVLTDLAYGLAGDDPERRARTIAAEATTRQAAGEFRVAATMYREAIELAPDDPAVWHTNLAVMLDEQGRFAEGELEHRTALRLKHEALGPDHPSVASSHNNLGGGLLQQGLYDQAEEQFEAALRIRIAAHGEAHPSVASVRNNLGAVAFRRDDVTEAVAQWEHALAIRVKTVGPDHVSVGESHNNLGLAYWFLHRNDDARRELEAAIAIWQEVLGPRHPSVARAQSNLGELLLDLGDSEAAATVLAEALEIQTETLGKEHPKVARTEGNLRRARAAQEASRASEKPFLDHEVGGERRFSASP